MLDKVYEILLVDDKKENLKLLESFLMGYGYIIRSAIHPELALMSIEKQLPDLILLDIEMPDMNGYEVCQKLKSNPKTKDIPVIFLSAHTDIEAKIKAFQAGGVDYISKPFANEEVVARVQTHLRLIDYQHHLEYKVQKGLEKISSLNKELELTQDEMIYSLSTILETRDDDTGKHVVRVSEYARLLAQFYGLDEKEVDLIYKATPFHDAGKVAIPDSILNKPDKLDPNEWEIMKTHSMRGYEIFKDAKTPILKMAAIIAKEHHERWDGSGYPDGLKGKEIHIAGRIVILADIFDALTNKRVYKPAWSFERSVEIIKEERGSTFEPKIVDIFLENLDAFREIYEKFKE